MELATKDSHPFGRYLLVIVTGNKDLMLLRVKPSQVYDAQGLEEMQLL